MIRRRLSITGVVQGVGFRPFVWRQATRLGLSGFVENTPAGVVAEVQGAGDAVAELDEEGWAQAMDRVHEALEANAGKVTEPPLPPRSLASLTRRQTDRAVRAETQRRTAHRAETTETL